MKNTLTALTIGIAGIFGYSAFTSKSIKKKPIKMFIHSDSIKIWALDTNGNALDSSLLNESYEFKFTHLKSGTYNLKIQNFKTHQVSISTDVRIDHPNLLTKLDPKYRVIPKTLPKKAIEKPHIILDSYKAISTIDLERADDASMGKDVETSMAAMPLMMDKSSSPKTESVRTTSESKMRTKKAITEKPGIGKREETIVKRPDAGISGSAKVLTAGIWNDLENWDKFEKTHLKPEVMNVQNTWGIYLLNHRFGVEIVDAAGKPAISVKVSLKNKEGVIVWSSFTDNRGKAELWNKPFENVTKLDDAFQLYVTIGEKEDNLGKIKATGTGYDRFVISDKPKFEANVDVCFVVDATGSMGDEINFLKEELMDVMLQFQKTAPCSPIRLSSVFYRDYGDEYVTKKMPFTSRIDDVVSFVSEQYAGGGGDFPEAVQSGLDVAINELNWNKEALTRIIFLVLDAPPHVHDAAKIRNLMQQASEKGIKIIPITASGIDQSTEFCMKYLSAGTGGDYIYITDHSGIGNSHIKPTGVKEDVDLLNTQILKSLQKYSTWEGCKKSNQIDQTVEPRVDIFGNNQLQISSYPNPASDYIQIKCNELPSNISIFNLNGQLVVELKQIQDLENKIDVQKLSEGLYILKVIIKEQSFSNKFFVTRQNQSQRSQKD